ncbi:hypothetical protein EON67_00105 [archaeon]|nr:MAG: hypothetical protein EON67_00105 [archaeon]
MPACLNSFWACRPAAYTWSFASACPRCRTSRRRTWMCTHACELAWTRCTALRLAGAARRVVREGTRVHRTFNHNPLRAHGISNCKDRLNSAKKQGRRGYILVCQPSTVHRTWCACACARTRTARTSRAVCAAAGVVWRARMRKGLLFALWLCCEAALCEYKLLTERSCAFDWDAYMEQVARLFPHAASHFPEEDADLSRFDLADSYTFNYSRLRGDTGPLVYPGAHVAIHAVMYKVTGWDAAGWTTEYTPKDMPGYEQRTHRPHARIMWVQQWYTLLYLALLSIVWLTYDGIGMVCGERPPVGAPCSQACRRRAVCMCVRGARVQTSSTRQHLMLLLMLSISRRVRNIPTLGLFNDTYSMLLAYAAVFAFSCKRWTLGSVLFSTAVATKLNVILMAPGLLYLLLWGGGWPLALQNIALCALVQAVFGAPFMLTDAGAYISRAFDLKRQFTQEWSVNWNFLPADVFSAPTFALLLLGAHVVMIGVLWCGAFPVWLPPRAAAPVPAPCVQGVSSGILMRSEAGRSGKAAGTESSAAPHVTLSHERADGFVSGAVSSTSSVSTGLSNRKKVAKALPVAAWPIQALPTRVVPSTAAVDEHDRLGMCAAFRAHPAHPGMLTASVRVHDVRSCAGLVAVMFAVNFVGLACARSLHYQFFLWYFHMLPLLLHVGRFPWWSHVPLTLALELAWGVHPPTWLSSLVVTSLHVAILAAILSTTAVVHQLRAGASWLRQRARAACNTK